MRTLHSSSSASGLVLLTGFLAAAAASAGQHAMLARMDTAPRPDGRRYVGLGDLAPEVGAQDLVDPLTSVYSLRRGDRCVSVVPGIGAALVGGDLVMLDEAPVVRYGQAFVPRSLLSRIRRLFPFLVRGGPGYARPPQPPLVGPGPTRPVGRVCVDAGHGGKDPGACSPWGLEEKEITLATAQTLAAELKQRGYAVTMTREGDTFIELNDRPAIACRCKCDLFVAVHANSISDLSMQGIEIFYCDGHNAAATEATRRESIELAEALRNTFVSAGITVRSIRPAGYRVLRLSPMPAVLVEVGFLTNRGEERLLRTGSYRQRIARSIADGIVLYQRK
jgi:N-acetylmuramoyl-L-alanine amidase